jgi:thiol-disulfide isomerase/thioredoxin
MLAWRRIAAVLVLVVGALGGCGGGNQRVEIGKRAPGIQAAAIVDGQRVDLASFRGRATLVNFWGSWCDPCRKELPRLVEAERSGTAVLGVAVRDSRRRAREMLAEYQATWPSADDPEGVIARRWGVGSGFPVTFAVNGAGVVTGRHFGEMSTADLDALIATARS